MEDESFKTSRKEKRLKILAADEIESIYGRPCFTDEEQTEYFALSQSELELLEGFRTIKSQVYFILQYCLISRVRHYSDEAKSVAKERLYECFVEINENLQKAGQVLKLLTDESIAPDTPFQAIQSNVFGILPRQKLMALFVKLILT